MKPLRFFSRLFDDKDPIIIMPYGGYATDFSIHAQARVLEDEGIVYKESGGILRNLYNSYKRFESDEVPNAKVVVECLNNTFEYLSDREGYIYVDETISRKNMKPSSSDWVPITYKLMLEDKVVYEVQSKLMKPSPSAEFGIISDVDDTILDTGLVSKFKYRVVINTLFKHSTKRRPLKGTKEFYSLLSEGKDGKNHNPLFYLSNGPWNLFGYLNDFLNFHNFPKGTLLLRDWDRKKKKQGFLEGNKFIKISHILKTYPNLRFVLIGDAADLDHQIYTEIAKRFPERIICIYIRSVKHKKKMRYVEKIIENSTHIEVKLYNNAFEAMEHAKKLNLIN